MEILLINFHSQNQNLSLRRSLIFQKLHSSIIKAFKKLESEKRRTDGYTTLSMVYARSPFREFESYLIFVVDLDEDHIQLILKQNSSNFVTYGKSRGIYSTKIFQRLCIPWVIMKEPYMLNMMI